MQEHDITTLGLLLGLAASHRGTMDPAISKVLLTSVCCTCMFTFISWVYLIIMDVRELVEESFIQSAYSSIPHIRSDFFLGNLIYFLCR